MTTVETTKGALKTANVVLSHKLVERDAQIKDLRRKLRDVTTERDVFKGGVAGLVADRERLREYLDGLVTAAREFSTQAHYTVERAVEEDFIDALAEAEEALSREQNS